MTQKEDLPNCDEIDEAIETQQKKVNKILDVIIYVLVVACIVVGMIIYDKGL